MRALILSLLLMPSLALAQQQQRPQQAPRQDDLGAQVDRNLRSCMGSSQDMALAARCMDAQRATVAPRLDRAVERLLGAQPDPGRRAALSEVQAAWAVYRDRRCDFAGTDPARPAEAAADRAACLLQFDVGRILEVEATLEPPRPPPQAQPPRR